MPSSATRSGRQLKGKQVDKEDSKDAVRTGKITNQKSSDSNSPASSGRSNEDSGGKEQVPVDGNKKTPKRALRENEDDKEASPSSSVVRRSSRAPVPSSRFKDMEMSLTPNAQRGKRILPKSPSNNSDASPDPSPKRSRKNSAKGSEVAVPASDIECVIPSQDMEQKNVDSSIAKGGLYSEEKEICLPKQDKENDLPLQDQTKIEHQEEDTDGSKQEDNALGDQGSFDIVMETTEDKIADDGNKESPGSEAEKMPIIESPVKKDVTSEVVDSGSVVSTELSSNPPGVSLEATQPEVSVEEVGLSCHDGGIIVEETVHTYMDEKDVVVIQNRDVPGEDVSIPHQPSSDTDSKKVEFKLDTDSIFKGQEVTVQEKDGKMVAIVKIPPNLSSHLASTPSSTKQVIQIDKSLEDQYPALSSLRNVTLSAPAPAKNRHGYILNKKTNEQHQVLAIADQDQNKFVNISLEPATISSILKPKQESSPVKAVSKSLYGRVIKQDSGVSKIGAEVPTMAPNSSQSNLVIKKTSSNQQISLLSHPLKATSGKDNKPYSLLSSPSELLQKLKANSEKKTVVEPKKPSSAPTKVVIITHPPKSDPGAEKSSDSLLTASTVKSKYTTLEVPGNSAATDSHGSQNSESKSEVLIQQDDLSQITEIQAMGDIAEVQELVGDSNKVEEIVVPTIFSDSENDGNKDLQSLEGFSSDEKDSDSVKAEGANQETSAAQSDESLLKASIDKPEETFSDTEKTEQDVKDSLLLLAEADKMTSEETVITSVPTEVQVKEELGLDLEEFASGKPEELLAVEDSKDKEAGETSSSPKTQKIKLVDNGVVYELRIVSEGGSSSLKDGSTLELEGMDIDEQGGMVVKQEIVEEEEHASSETAASGKSTLGTQTIYTSKRGRPKATSDNEDVDSPVHKLATIVQEGGQKKHYYYVSVVPGKTIVGKYRRSVDHSLPGCVVNEDGEYCCKECDYKTDKKANFYKHRRLHTGSKPHVCHVCKYQARTSSNLKRHMGIHEDIREFKCNQCSLSFRQKIHLERHIRYRHEEKRVKCPMCDYVCANEQPDLKMHIKRKHTQESGKVFTCPQCNAEVGSKRDLKQHLKFHKEGPELKLFCKECSFVTDCKSRLQRHLVVHSNVKPYHCGVCDYKATQKEHVVRHLRSQHKIEVNKPKRPWKKQIKQESSETMGGNSRGDFTCGDKIFACNHCTMRFAKLINLYKHLHTQHSDIMPAETDNNYYCVVCEFSTSSKKNLLVHMRRHNMTDQTPPTHVYSCVLCRYVNPRRRNLFQHMRKKHNIDISTQVDIAGMTEEEEAAARQEGDKMSEFIQTDQSVFTQASTEEMAATSFENADGTQVIKDNLAGVANMIKIEDLTRVAAGPEMTDGVKSLVIDSSDGTQLIQATLLHHKAADAIEGLQALAGQAGLVIDEEVSSLDKQSTIVIEQSAGDVINAATDGTLPEGSIILSADQGIVDQQVTIGEAASEQIQHIVESVEAVDGGAGMTSVELTEEQLSSLHHGDIVQMEGQVYMVEIAPDPESPDKQLLSFLPINQQ